MTSELSFEAGNLSVTLVVKPSVRARVLRLRVDPRTGGVVLIVPRGDSQRVKEAVEALARRGLEPPEELTGPKP